MTFKKTVEYKLYVLKVVRFTNKNILERDWTVLDDIKSLYFLFKYFNWTVFGKANFCFAKDGKFFSVHPFSYKGCPTWTPVTL